MKSQEDNLFTLDQVQADLENDYVLAYRLEDGTPMYRRAMTEKEMYRESMYEWVGIISQLWDAIGKPVDEKRLDLYCKQLRDVPIGLLEIGVNYAIKNNTYTTVPTIGMIWEGIRKETNKLNLPPGTDMDIAIERWIERRFKTSFYIFGESSNPLN